MQKPNLCISRIDNPSSHGLIVRIRREKEHIVRFFSDMKFGGKRLSQQSAKNFRDVTVERLHREGKLPRIRKIVSRQSRNKSGVIGVSRVTKKLSDGRAVSYFAVTWHPQPGVQRGTTISIEKYGEEKAFKKACAIRNRQLMRRFGSGVFRKIKALRETREAAGKPSLPTLAAQV